MSHKNTKTCWNQAQQQKSYHWNKYLGSFSNKIYGAFLKTDKLGTQTNGAKNKECDDVMHTGWHPRDDIDNMCQEKEEEGDLPTLIFA